jgi:hypothetical protein
VVRYQAVKFADDFYLFADRQKIMQKFEWLQERCATVNLAFKTANSEMYVPAISSNRLRATQKNIPKANTNEGMIALGVSIGNTEWSVSS